MRCTLLQYTICALIGALVLLQLIHLTMLSWLEDRDHDFHHNKAKGVVEHRQNPEKNHSKMYYQTNIPRRIIMHSPKLNTYGSYQIFYDFARTQRRPKPLNRRDVTLITHCSMNNLHHLPELVERWKGPISLAVFGSASDALNIISYVLSLQECHVGIRKNVTFHLVHPVTSVDEDASIYGVGRNKFSLLVPLVHCRKLMDAIKESSTIVKNYVQGGILYPNNLLRNVGRANIFTDYHFVLDVDMLPSQGLREDFLGFIQGSTSLWLDKDMVHQMVFVLPAFEVDVGAVSQMPRNKQELITLVDMGQARQFYVEACSYCQNHTDYARWTKLQSTGQIGIAYTVEWKPVWEPFYISRGDAPLYDERFRQYGYNRISQVSYYEYHIQSPPSKGRHVRLNVFQWLPYLSKGGV